MYAIWKEGQPEGKVIMDFKDNSEFYYFEAKNGKIDGKRLHNNANTRS